jgi:uncharacterized membrane protein YgcG
MSDFLILTIALSVFVFAMIVLEIRRRKKIVEALKPDLPKTPGMDKPVTSTQSSQRKYVPKPQYVQSPTYRSKPEYIAPKPTPNYTIVTRQEDPTYSTGHYTPIILVISDFDTSSSDSDYSSSSSDFDGGSGGDFGGGGASDDW